jgi:hypothetical protein
MHGLAGQKFANAGTQHSTAIATARVGRGACAFELQLLHACGALNSAKVQGPAITQLTCPLAKLVTAVDTGVGGVFGYTSVACEEL